MNCRDCMEVEPIKDTGVLKLRPATAQSAQMLRTAGYEPEEEGQALTLPYASRDELLDLLGSLEQGTQPVEISFSSSPPAAVKAAGEGHTGNWRTLEQLNARFAGGKLVDIIAGREFGSHMQPIVDVKRNVVGFEFLLRPLPGGRPFSPHELFETARLSGLHTFLDRAARISAIETAARHLPGGLKRFINFLPSSIYNPQYCLTHTFAAIEQTNQDPADFVFEVVETEKIADVSHLATIFAAYKSRGMRVALDDVGAGHSTVEVMSLLKPDYVKLDRGLISFCDRDEEKQRRIAEIVKRASAFGAALLAEGIERPEEFDYCRSAGIELGQGYLFGKPAAAPVFLSA